MFTGEDAAVHWAAIPGARVKNLFLRNKKGNRHYLVILEIEKQADLRRLVKVIGDDRFSFGVTGAAAGAPRADARDRCRRSAC